MKNEQYQNEFGDTVFYSCSFMGKRGMCHSYILSMDSKYVRTFGSINLAKSEANKIRGLKTKWFISEG